MAGSPQGRLTRSSALAWLDRRLNFERTVPVAAAGAGTFGLARVRRLLAALGDPQRRVPVVHVAGTKGKGSTVAMLAAILQAARFSRCAAEGLKRQLVGGAADPLREAGECQSSRACSARSPGCRSACSERSRGCAAGDGVAGLCNH